MAAPVLVPLPQFCDADGEPYAGGTIETYVEGTSTPKTTWVDPDQAAMNTNPIVLDAAGRCRMWGDGEYRLVLRDAVGNLIWDSPATTLVSAAMAPVMLAPTIADAVNQLGIDDLIAAEASARAAGDSAEQTARIAADNALGTRIDNEITARTEADAALGARIDDMAPTSGPTRMMGGAIPCIDGHGRVNFSQPFDTLISCVGCISGDDFEAISVKVHADPGGADFYCSVRIAGPPYEQAVGANVWWIAIGANDA